MHIAFQQIPISLLSKGTGSMNLNFKDTGYFPPNDLRVSEGSSSGRATSIKYVNVRAQRRSSQDDGVWDCRVAKQRGNWQH